MGNTIKGKKITKAQKNKAVKIAILIDQLAKGGVETILHEDNLCFFRGLIPFDFFPDEETIYQPEPRIKIRNFVP